MIKIVKSLAMIAFVAAIAVGATSSYFSDTETSTGNIMQAGSLDLTVNSKDDPNVSAVVVIEDMKPSIVKYSAPITLEVTNNRGRLYKHIVKPTNGIVCDTGNLTEPECTEQRGTWVPNATGANRCVWPSGVVDKNDLPTETWFDLAVWVGLTPPTAQDVDRTDPICNNTITTNCWKTIIPDNTVTVDQIASKMIYLGEYGTDMTVNKITIRQSFHLKDTVINWAQGDRCEFTEKFKVEQTNAPHPADCYDPSTSGNVCSST